jgi:hypothetical protein
VTKKDTFLFESEDTQMKKVILLAMTLVLVSPLANAKTKNLSGDSACEFLAKYFPDAAIPGRVSGRFSYINKRGELKHGYADCFYPAMGGRSNGIVPSCEVIY